MKKTSFLAAIFAIASLLFYACGPYDCVGVLCDIDGEAPSSSRQSGAITGLTITDTPTAIVITGVITTNEGVKVKKVDALVTGKTVEIKDGVGTTLNSKLPLASVNLAGYTLNGVCAEDNGVNPYDITISVTFTDETTISEPKKVNVDCGGGDILPQGSYVLSLAGDSYLDVDEGKTYKQNELTADIKELIDVVAYWTGTAGDNVYAPWAVHTIGDAFGWARIFETKADLDAAYDIDEGEEKIAISAGSSFIIESSEFDAFKVTVTQIGGYSVTLKVEELP